MRRRGRMVLPVALLAALPLSGCGGDATPDGSGPPQALATASTLNSPLPTGWPDDIALPAGADVFNAKADGGRLSVGFESQELANAVAAFLEKEITGAGFRELSRKQTSTGLTVNYTGGTRSASFELTDEGATTEVDLVVTVPTSSTSPGSSPSPGSPTSPTSAP